MSSAEQRCPCRHLSPSLNVLKVIKGLPPRSEAPSGLPRARQLIIQTPDWVGIGHSFWVQGVGLSLGKTARFARTEVAPLVGVVPQY